MRIEYKDLYLDRIERMHGPEIRKRAERILERVRSTVFNDWAVTREALGRDHPIVRTMDRSREHGFNYFFQD